MKTIIKPNITAALLISASLLTTSSISFAQNSSHEHNHDHSSIHTNHSSHSSAHGPIGVMGDHRHKQGEIMFSYRAMRMNMNGNRIGTDRVTPCQVVGTGANPGKFMVVPLKMTMDMHMFGSMYGLNDNVTLMAMVPYLKNSMDHLIRNGKEFTTESSGFGDAKVSALIGLSENDSQKVHMGIGVSLPTGSTSERDDTPAMKNAFLPYPMQLGSGTYDILPSITYVKSADKTSWGSQLSAVIHAGTNDQSYTLGDRLAATTWVARSFSPTLSGSVRLNYQNWKNVDGKNPMLNPMMIQTANANLLGGKRLDVSLGLNYTFNNGHRLALEASIPAYQNLNGPQMETDSVVTLGWQKAL